MYILFLLFVFLFCINCLFSRNVRGWGNKSAAFVLGAWVLLKLFAVLLHEMHKLGA